MKNVSYAIAVGNFMYAMVCTRSNIAHVVGFIGRFLSNPGKDHWQVMKWIFRYLRGTSKVSLCFGRGDHVLEGYTNANMGENVLLDT